ncbi:MAG: hypothetical protein LBF68_00705 [Christensenellaceae bacterium]|jgi:hypothetical protein|nr:hypothetical protein [Christensenellaceae bacterium]
MELYQNKRTIDPHKTVKSDKNDVKLSKVLLIDITENIILISDANPM